MIGRVRERVRLWRRDHREAPRRVEAVLRLVVRFIHEEATGGLLLLLCALIALLWANSPWGESYFSLWETLLTVQLGPFLLEKPLLLWINEGLMGLFFFVVGLEIKRELLVGALSSPRKAMLPLVAAVGGMLVPALIYALLNGGQPTLRGWGIPMATDIAFSLGVLTLLGARAPLSLKVFLLALAIVDDMGAVLVIALFYSHDVAASYVLLGLGLVALAGALGRLGIRHPGAYLALGGVVWWAFLESGVHATVAGVLLAFTIPARNRMDLRSFVALGREILSELDRANTSLGAHDREREARRQAAVSALELACREVEPPLQRLERVLHPWVVFLVMPLFALANAGVALDFTGFAGLVSPVSVGVALGLLVGKPVGITLFSWLAVRLGLATLPAELTWRHIAGVGLLGGIGFTMALFIAQLAFPAFDGAELDQAKIGILTGSLLAGLAGWAVLRGIPMPPR